LPTTIGKALESTIRPYWRIVRLLPAVSPLLTAGVALGVMLGAALPLVMTVAVGTLVGTVPTAIAAGPGSAGARAAFETLGAVGVLFVLARALGSVRFGLAATLGRRLNEHLHERVMRAS
jgi:ATP-binding cassette, subfamily B, bacterial